VYSMPRVPPEGTTQAQSVCGNKLKGMTTYECHDQKYKKQLASVGVDCRKDDETIHPRSFCNRCYTAARQHTSLGSTLVVPFRPRSHDLSHYPREHQMPAMLHQPLQVGCGALLCATCITTWVQSSSSEAVLCPCCQDEKLKPDCIRPAPHAIVELLDNM
jgi:hypothetical protein